jgi:quercetin dioxygenase-like cupin family protein
MSDRFEDGRGTIQDIITGEFDSATEIYTREGGVRGNHIHAETTQWTYIVYGSLFVVHQDSDGTRHERTYNRGELIEEPPGVAHAWEAVESTLVIVFTKGPRSGANYESDTQRLAEEDKLL